MSGHVALALLPFRVSSDRRALCSSCVLLLMCVSCSVHWSRLIRLPLVAAAPLRLHRGTGTTAAAAT